MSNPFLFDDDEGDVAADPASNPFLQDAPAESAQFETADNPFFGQAAQTVNPFADYAAESVPVSSETPKVIEDVPVTTASTAAAGGKVDSAMSFFGTTIKDEEEDHETQSIYDAAQAGQKKAAIAPPQRPNPPNQATQDLISTIADQLDQTSSHLLGRIPVTRTPSPVSMRDLHSPSPTPECSDLLDVTENLELDQTDTNVGNGLGTDNPFADIGDDPQAASVEQSIFDLESNASVPAKVLPPARPPRPTPPRRPSPPSHTDQPAVPTDAAIAKDADADLFDMFGTTAAPKSQPNVPKSNQDIMNLFSAPPKSTVAEPQHDLLTSDIFSMANDAPIPTNLPSVLPNPKPPAPPKPRPPVVPRNQNGHASVPKADIAHVEPELPAATAQPTQVVEELPIVPQIDTLSIENDKNDSFSDQSSAVSSNIAVSDVASPFHSASVPTGDYLNNAQSPVSREEIVTSYINQTAQAMPATDINPFGQPEAIVQPTIPITYERDNDEFDAFAAKFDSVKKEDTSLLDGFGVASQGNSGYKSPAPAADAWGASDFVQAGEAAGFEADEGFDTFLAMDAPPEQDSPKDGLNVFIRPLGTEKTLGSSSAILAPPPSRGSQNSSIFCDDSSPRPSDRSDEAMSARSLPLSEQELKMHRTESQESPSTPLFDDDVSQPLEDFPRVTYVGDGWEMQLRQPNKKKITGQRFWKKIFLRFVYQGDTPCVHLLNSAKDKDPFQELPLQGCYSVSEICAQPFDQFGKIFTVKLQYIFYKERPGLRPGQVTKAERITNKLSQFAAYAIQGDYQGVKEFGSDLKKLGLPVEHAPQVSQLFKIGSHNYEDLKQFSVCIEEQLFKFNVHRDRALTYKMEEIQVTSVDEIYVEQDAEGHVLKQIARVRLFLLAFLTGMPTIELGVNDLWRQGKEVVGRHDIIPVVTEEFIRLEGVEFHSCVQQNEYERSRLIRFQPPDACYIELMRFRVRPPKNRELPLQLKAVWCVTGNKVELRADILVPGFASRKLGQIPCEDVSIRFPIPECWIYLFRVEKHFRYGSVKSAHRRTGKIKGIERILGTVDQLQESLIEVTSGQAKYEHHHRAIVWRCPRLPKEGQGAYTTHQMVVRMALTSYDQIPEKLAEHCFVEFTMPATQVSHTTIRSVSVQDSDSDDPPEKYVRYLARHEYRVGIEYTQGETQNAYLAATTVKKAAPAPAIKEEVPAPIPEAGSDSDSDSN